MKCVKHLSFLFGVDVGTIQHGFGASNTARGLHWHQAASSDPGFQLTFPNLDGLVSGMMTNPYPHPKHMKVIKNLSYVWSGCGNHST